MLSEERGTRKLSKQARFYRLHRDLADDEGFHWQVDAAPRTTNNSDVTDSFRTNPFAFCKTVILKYGFAYLQF